MEALRDIYLDKLDALAREHVPFLDAHRRRGQVAKVFVGKVGRSGSCGLGQSKPVRRHTNAWTARRRRRGVERSVGPVRNAASPLRALTQARLLLLRWLVVHHIAAVHVCFGQQAAVGTCEQPSCFFTCGVFGRFGIRPPDAAPKSRCLLEDRTGLDVCCLRFRLRFRVCRELSAFAGRVRTRTAMSAAMPAADEALAVSPRRGSNQHGMQPQRGREAQHSGAHAFTATHTPR